MDKKRQSPSTQRRTKADGGYPIKVYTRKGGKYGDNRYVPSETGRINSQNEATGARIRNDREHTNSTASGRAANAVLKRNKKK